MIRMTRFRVFYSLVLLTVSLGTRAICSSAKFNGNAFTDGDQKGFDGFYKYKNAGLRENLEFGPPISNTARSRSNLEFQSSNSSAEAQVLLDFRDGITRDPFNVLSNWSSQNEASYCNWTGIRCRDHSGPVVALNLSGLQLAGSISPSLEGLQFLVLLDLSNNSLGGPVPPSLANCSSLRELDLYLNELSGSIPRELANMQSLTSLDLSYNLLEGSISRDQTFGRNLVYLDLSHNNLAGVIPETLANSTYLTVLILAHNSLGGQVPQNLGRLSQLQYLYLDQNQLSGPIPKTLANCTSVSYLGLSVNSIGGEIPTDLGSLSNLIYLALHTNNLTGMIPASVEKWPHLENLLLSSNRLVGSIPTQLGQLQNVSYIDFGRNSLTGAIPDALGKCTLLRGLDLSSNMLTGKIPDSLTDLKHLTFFNVSSNNLTGRVPDSGSFANFSGGSYQANPALCGRMLPNKCDSGGHTPVWVIIVPVVAALVVASVAALIAVKAGLCACIAKKSERKAVVVPAVPSVTHFSNKFQDLSLEDIIAATDGFSDANVLGVGMRSTVYRGVLPNGDTIAVKRLRQRNDDNAAAQLYRQLQRLSALDHPYLLKVHGLYSTPDLKALVSAHMANGSLRKQLYEVGDCPLTWMQRLDIALGVSEALVYLHHSRAKPVLHLDLKPSNILLTERMEPKVADYGVSEIINHEDHGEISVSSNVYGTIGYIPPEYGAMTGVSTKGDVYNFGMVLMELLTRKQPTDDMFDQEVSLRSWIVDAYPERVPDVLDNTLISQGDQQQLGIRLMIRLAIACTQSAPKERPAMPEARDMLLQIRSMQLPYKGAPSRASESDRG